MIDLYFYKDFSHEMCGNSPHKILVLNYMSEWPIVSQNLQEQIKKYELMIELELRQSKEGITHLFS